MPRPYLLTIGLPTFNRSFVLDECFQRLFVICEKFHQSVCFLISDNFSSDATEEICSRWAPRFAEYTQFRYIRQTANIGLSANVLFLYQNANSEYFVLIGDDDYFHPDVFGRMLQILNQHQPSAVIQNIWLAKRITTLSGLVSAQAAHQLIYEYGNTWGGVLQMSHVQKYFSDKLFMDSIKGNVWAHTALAFCCINAMSKEKKVFVLNDELGDQFADHTLSHNNAKYWTTVINDLFRVVDVINRQADNTWATQVFLTRRNISLVKLFKFLYMAILMENKRPANVNSLIFTLLRSFGLRGFLSGSVVWLTTFPKVLTCIAVLGYALQRKKSLSLAMKALQALRDSYAHNLSRLDKSKTRIDNWF